MTTYSEAKSEFRIMTSGDSWGEAMGWWFAIAEEIFFNRRGSAVVWVPDDWEFRPSSFGCTNKPDDIVTLVVQEMSDKELKRLGDLMNRYCRLLKHLGKDY